MSTDQVLLFTLLTVVFVLLIWGRWRYDLVAFLSLLVAVAPGLVPAPEAFAGFGHPAVVIIALMYTKRVPCKCMHLFFMFFVSPTKNGCLSNNSKTALQL